MNAIAKFSLACGCSSAFLGVILGAFGAHFLKTRIDAYALSVFEVGVRYQFYHAFALILYAYFLQWTPSPWLLPAVAFLLGTILFSGSLYALALSGVKILGAITPVGGLAFLIGWLSWLLKILK